MTTADEPGHDHDEDSRGDPVDIPNDDGKPSQDYPEHDERSK